MRTLILGVACALAASEHGSAPVSGEEVPTRRMQIKCEAYELRDDGKKTSLSRPQLVTIEGMPASFTAGRPVIVEIEKERKLEIAAGVACEVACHCLDTGKVKLDLRFEITTPVDDNAVPRDGEEGIVTRTSGVRVVRTVAWGERVVVPLRNDAGKVTHAIELVVTEQFPLIAAEPLPDEVPPAPRRRPMLDVGGGVPFRPASVPGIR